MPKSSMKDRICATDGMILRPPDAPTASAPIRGDSATVGHMLLSGRAPGRIEFGLPGTGSNHIMPLFIRMPVEGDSTNEPKRDSSVWVQATTLPSLSATQKWLVQLGRVSLSLAPMFLSRSR